MISRRSVAVLLAALLPAGVGCFVGVGSAASASPAARAGAPGTAKSVQTSKNLKTHTVLTLRSSAPTGVIMPNPKVYLVFWGSQWSNDPAGAAPALQAMFTNLVGSQDTWGTILDQYCEGLPVGTSSCGSLGTHVQHPSSGLLAGVWFDNAAPTPSKASISQLAAEAVSAANHFGNTTQAPNLNAQYVIASPTGTHPDGFPGSFCGWHDFTTTSSGVNIAYTNLPYVPDLGNGACTTLSPARLIDGYESTETHEYAETVTDPFPSTGWLAKGGSEIGDLCINLDAYLITKGGTFDVQGLWSNAATSCVTQG